MEGNNQNKKRNVWLFFIITFAFSWLVWLPYVLSGFNVIELSETVQSMMTLAVVIGAFGPMIAALILIRVKEGKSGIKEYFRRAFNFKTKAIYYLMALLIPVIITAAAHYIVTLGAIDVLPKNLFPEELAVPVIVLVIPYFIFIMIAGGGQEEFGWRGYAQEPLQGKFGILGGSILLGAVWGLWHLPLWFMPGEGHSYYSFFAFLIYTVSTAVIIGWLYNASGKKLIIPWLIHSAGNVAVPFFPILHMEDVPQPGYWIWVSVSTFAAVCVTILYMVKIKKNPELFKGQE